jgi:hypothetical protein
MAIRPDSVLERFVVTVHVKGVGDYELEVPTYQGIEAAKRRAEFSVAAMHPTIDMRRITVTDARKEDADGN